MPGRCRKIITGVRVIENAAPGDVLKDTQEGLYLHVNRDGSKSWIFRYRGRPGPSGKRIQRAVKLGRWPGLSLSDARKEARAWGSAAKNGRDLHYERKPAEKAAEEARQVAARRGVPGPAVSPAECGYYAPGSVPRRRRGPSGWAGIDHHVTHSGDPIVAVNAYAGPRCSR